MGAQALYQKQGRSSQFGSRQERDAWIGEEVRTLERAAAVKRSSAADLRSQVQQLSQQLMDLSQVRSTDATKSGKLPSEAVVCYRYSWVDSLIRGDGFRSCPPSSWTSSR